MGIFGQTAGNWITVDSVQELCAKGHLFQQRYRKTSDPNDLIQAIQLWMQAGEVAAAAAGLHDLYRHTGNLDQLQWAIETHESALALAPLTSGTVARLLNNYGNALMDRYLHTHDPGDLDAAVAAAESAVAACVDPRDRACYLGNLGSRLLARHELAGDSRDLDAAGQGLAEALLSGALDADTSPVVLDSLGTALIRKFSRNRRPELLDDAIDAHLHAVAQCPPGRPELPAALINLGNALSTRGKEKDIANAITAFRQACDTASNAGQWWPMLGAAQNWGDLSTETGDWDGAAAAYRYGVDAADRLFRLQVRHAHREAWLAKASLFVEWAPYAFAKAGQVREAVAAVELLRARLLTDSFDIDPVRLDSLLNIGRKDLYDSYHRARDRIADAREQDRRSLDGIGVTRFDPVIGFATAPPTGTAEQVRRELVQAQDELAEILREIDGTAPRTDLSDRPPLAFLLAGRDGGLALITHADGSAERLWLPLATEAELLRRLNIYANAYRARRQDLDLWRTRMDETTFWLGEAIIGPLVEATAHAAQVLLAPIGLLGFLPLHAAWTPDPSNALGRRYALDTTLFTYAANTRAAEAAIQRAQDRSADAVFAVGGVVSLYEADLPSSEFEVRQTLAAFAGCGRAVTGSEATRQAVQDAFGEYPVIHLACHGMASPVSHLNHALMLSDGYLPLRDLLGLNLSQTRLVVLSSCESALPGAQLPDEALSLPNAFASIGIPGGVATLTSVPDDIALIIMLRFYYYLRDERLSPPESLRRAQLWTRDTTNAEKRAFLPHIGAGVPDAVRPFWENARMHADPVHWAPFVYVGA